LARKAMSAERALSHRFPPARDARVLEVVQRHAPGLLRLARRHSLCADDAQDAYQRALEIFLRRVDSLEPEGMVSWLRTVVKHEAMAVRESRQRVVATDDADLDRHEASRLPTADETVDRFDLLSRAAEALQQLKAHEVRALVLKAQGHSYAEICQITGWSYTKVNRCLTEGRRALRRLLEEAEA
jgi:RNA polymerase sigma factor (sigma-70 family)